MKPSILKIGVSEEVMVIDQVLERPLKVNFAVPLAPRLFKLASQYLEFAYLFSRAPSDSVLKLNFLPSLF